MTVKELTSNLNVAANAKSHSECAVLCRELLEDAIGFIFNKSGYEVPKNASLLELIDNRITETYLEDEDIVNALHYVRILGMNAKHGQTVHKKAAKLAIDNMSYLIGLISAKETGTAKAYKKPPYMSEAATRKLYIDQYLNEAGWEVLDTDNIAQPCKAGIEIEVLGMPNGHGKGYCDYVLYGRNGKPLAIVEVKKTSVDPAVGRHQVDLYGECMKAIYGYKPVLYYTNGYVTKVIDGLYPDRVVMGFHTIDDLELMIQRRSRGSISDMSVNQEITGRPYQQMAITNICEWFNLNHRRGLVVMATGTGKTRLAVSLVDILSRNKWVKNVLFLADRTALVNQAKRAFEQLLPNMSICELSGSGEKDYNARLMFCTYQTMINYIDAETKQFSPGRFDLIIIDEAHRSIFNRYGSIFKYFDSFLIGLTATPKNEVDANTYRVFGCEAGVPNYDYSLEDAIKEHYLVGYHVINKTSKFISDGIEYDSLSDDEKAQLDDYLDEYNGGIPTPDFTIAGNEMYNFLFNKNTCEQVIEDLMNEGLRVNGGETIGKTIIFAYNHKHAQMIVDCFQYLHPELPPNTCQLVDYSVNYGDDLVLKFGSDPEFRIAVSVDMLDTGVDIPAVLNLVFFKKVRSKIKFVQMIGRGTRLCPNVYSDGKDKDRFYIFDYCGNFEYFNIHTDGKAMKETLTLSQRLFLVRLDMLFELQHIKYQSDAWFHAYYDSVKNLLHGDIVKIKSHDNRIQVRESMQWVDKYYDLKNWASLSPVQIKEVKMHIPALLESGTNGNHYSVAFDVRMYHIEKSLLAINSTAEAVEHVKNVRLIAQYLLKEKASVREVLNKKNDLETLMGDAFWVSPTVPELERLRNSLRDLMKYLEGGRRHTFDVDIVDDISESDFQPEDTIIDIRTYREKVIDYLTENLDSPVIKKIHNLEPIDGNDLKELERILWHELGTKEEYDNTTNIGNIAAFVRSLIGLSQESVNEKFGEYLNGNTLNSQQQEFLKTIINYARENGDIELNDLVNTEPFNEYNLIEVFSINIETLKSVVDVLHSTVTAA